MSLHEEGRGWATRHWPNETRTYQGAICVWWHHIRNSTSTVWEKRIQWQDDESNV